MSGSQKDPRGGALPSRYDFARYEREVYRMWEEGGYFSAPVDEDPEKVPHYCIVIPPPNITGELHMGHALNNTIQDVLIRYHRMLGEAVLWLPGTDHASIATENIVERGLAAEGLSKRDIGRGEFLKRVWRWKEKYGGIIAEQLRRLGVSCDWSRERFTMDEHLSRAVREAFVRLFRDGLIYRGEYLVNWCPRCRTALSDDEVERKEEPGSLWRLRYPFEDGSGHVEVATTRPETMLGDTAVAVHPDDARYGPLLGRRVVLPLLERPIPVIADEAVDPDFGTGAVKITPAHDPADFEMGRRHGLGFVNILNPDGTLNENAGPYAGLDRYEARKKVLEDLESRGLLGAVEEHVSAVGHCYRCGTAIEPYVSEQWFVKMRPLAGPAVAAVESGRMRFVPERWTDYYLSWLENVRDWCISRQLWWGHRIPVFYCDCGHTFADAGSPSSCPECGSASIRQDEDVLDTWFSSALWPFSTMGWPAYETGDGRALIERYFPTDVLVTDRGIIYFWVARMAMTSLRFMGDVPFPDVYIHGTILDETGRKMSKSLGNGIDPLEMIDVYGADAVRLSLLMLTVEGQDVKLSPTRFEMGRNFCNKLWNAVRFVASNVRDAPETPLDPEDLAVEDRWVLSRLQRLVARHHDLMRGYAFNAVLRELYEFVWHVYCDWYLELVKPRLRGELPGGAAAREVMFHVADATLRLLHPFMPFVTEHLWRALFESAAREKPKIRTIRAYDALEPMLMIAPAPEPREDLLDETAEAEAEALVACARAVREMKSRFGLPARREVDLVLAAEDESALEVFRRNEDFLRRMAQVGRFTYTSDTSRPRASAAAILSEVRLFVPLGGLVDLDKERARLRSRLDEAEKRIAKLERLLADGQFVGKAPPEVVEKQRTTLEELRAERERLDSALSELT